MSSVTELERMVVTLIGDTDKYTGGMDAAIKKSTDATQAIAAANDQTAASFKVVEEAQGAYAAGVENVKALVDSLRTPYEKYADSIANVEGLLKRKVITTETYNRAVNSLNEELAQASGEEQRLNQLMSRGQSITQAMLNPQERYNESLKELSDLLAWGAISTDTHARALAKLESELSEATGAEAELNALIDRGRALTEALMSPMEQYNASLRELNDLLEWGAINETTHAAGLARIKKELADVSGETERLNKIQRQAESITQAMLTPQERYAQSLNELDALLRDVAITSETYSRAVRSLDKDLAEATGETQRLLEVQRQAEAVLLSIQTPQEQHAKALSELDDLLKQAAISEDTYRRAVAQAQVELEEATGATAAHNDALRRAESITQSLLTPQERYAAGLRELNDLERQGALSADIYARALNRLEQELADATNQSKQFISNLQSAGGAISQVGSSIQNVGRSLSMYVTAPIVAMGALSVKAFADFDDAMTQSTAIMTVTEAETQRMVNAAMTLGTVGIHGPTELAQSYYFLASAGLDAEQSIAALPIVSRFAAAGMFDLEKSTELLSDSVSALGLASKDAITHQKNMIRVSDVLTKGAAVANASVEQFAESLTNKVAGRLRLTNKSIEEGVAVLMAYANQGEKGARGAEKMEIMLRELQNAALKQPEVWKKMGMSVFDTDGKLKHTADMIEMLENKLGTMSDEARATAMIDLGFMSESTSAVTVLFGLSDQIREFESVLKQAGGTTEDVATKQLASFTNQSKILWNQLSAVAIGIGQLLAPALMWVNARVKDLIAVWNGLTDSTKRVLLVIAGIVAVVGPMLVIFGTLVGVVGTVVTAIAAMAAVAAPVLATIGSIIATTALWVSGIGALLAVLAGLTYWLAGSDGLASAWNSATAALESFASKAYGFIANFSTNIGLLLGWLKSNWFNLFLDLGLAIIQYNINFIKNTVTAFHTVVRLAVAFAGMLGGTFRKLFSIDFVKYIWEGIKAAGAALLSFANNAAKAIASIFTGGAGSVSMKDFTNQLADDFVGGSEDFLGTARNILRDGISDLKGPLEDMQSTTSAMPQFAYGTGADIAKQTADGITSGVPGVEQAAADLAAASAQAASGASDVNNAVAEDVAELTAELNKSIATFGMSSRQAQIWEATVAGASAETVAQLKALDDQLVALEANKKLMDDAKQLTEELRSADEKFTDAKDQLNKMLAAGAISLDTYNRAIQKEEKALKDSNELLKEGEKITDSVMTAQEKHAKEVENLDKLLSAGAITQDTYNRALAKSEEDLNKLDKTVKPKVDTKGLDGIAAGSADALQAMLNYRALKPKIDVPPLPDATVKPKDQVAAGRRAVDMEVKAKLNEPTKTKEKHTDAVERLLATIAENTDTRNQKKIVLQEANL